MHVFSQLRKRGIFWISGDAAAKKMSTAELSGWDPRRSVGPVHIDSGDKDGGCINKCALPRGSALHCFGFFGANGSYKSYKLQ